MSTHLSESTQTTETHSVSRRNFIRSGALLAAGLAIGLPWFGGCTKSRHELEAIWNELAGKLQGTLLRPNYSGFREKAAPWALQYNNVLPLGIASCVSAQDVQTCILWARKYGIPLVARSGGHSYGGYSTTTGLMIDVSPMNQVTYNSAQRLLTAGGGARNKNVFAAGKQHQVAITHGRCFEVGVAGLTLGGGIGFDMRSNGYTCDKLVETEVVLANGEIITCNEKNHPDLFWACRGGGGGNFGIHTSFTFKAFPVGQITVFNIEWEQNIEQLLLASQTIIANAPRELGMKLGVTATRTPNGNKLKLYILGSYEGSREELMKLLSPMISIPKPKYIALKETPYWDGQELISEEGEPEWMHERSRFVRGYLSLNAIDTIINNLKKWPGTSVAATWKFFLLGGAIDEKKPTDMAMVHRGYTMLSSIDLEWSPADSNSVVAENEHWLSSFHQQMAPHTSGHCYQNFIDPSQQDYLQAYYGQNLEKLREVKRKYDPGNVFTYAQGIPA